VYLRGHVWESTSAGQGTHYMLRGERVNLFGRPTAGNCIDLDDITGRVVIYKVPDRKLRVCRIDYEGCEKGVSNAVVRL
jgi:hypothetical protein